MTIEGKMQGVKASYWFRKIAIVLFLAGMLLITSGFSALTAQVNIATSGTIRPQITPGPEITAQSGSAYDIQAAVNAVAAAGGGTVHVPTGNFTFNINPNNRGLDNTPVGVQIPGGVNVIGVGNNQTILYVPLSGWQSSTGGVGETTTVYKNTMFLLDGRNGKPIRISGIEFQGSVDMSPGADDNYHALVAIKELGVTDYRIDHNTFIDFSGAAIGTSNNYVHSSSGNRGVIDHNFIDNPYKSIFYSLTGNFPYWGYGIIVGGDGQWRTLDQVLGKYDRDVAYIEDNSFRRCRHEISEVGSGDGGWYVARHNTFTEMILSHYGSYVDVHGGGRGAEVYDNTIIDSPTTYASVGGQPNLVGGYLGRGVNFRGGSGVIFNNVFVHFQGNAAVVLNNDQSSNSAWRLNQVWVWGNTYVDTTNQLSTSQSYYPVLQNQEYYLRVPNLAQDGFTYTPYTYPFPLTNSGLPNPSG